MLSIFNGLAFFLAHLAKGKVSFCHHLASAVNRNANESSFLIGPISKQESNQKLPIVYKYLF
jgi:hypothetical protein